MQFLNPTKTLKISNLIYFRVCCNGFCTGSILQSDGLDHKQNAQNRFSNMLESICLAQNLPKDIQSSCQSHRLMVYNGIIQQCHPGAFYLLPMGMRALNKLQSIIDEEMINIGSQKISMPTLTPGKLWKKSGRWSNMGMELFRLKDRHGKDFCLGPTHEEAVTSLIASLNYPGISYRRLPIKLYQMTWKFRDEISPKHGLLRGREFLMKDLYTFDDSEDSAQVTYESVCEAYSRIFQRLGLDHVKVNGATGNIGGSLSHEYHLLAKTGEDTLMMCNNCTTGFNKELLDNESESDENSPLNCKKCGYGTLETKNGIEVGHTFLLGTKYSSEFKAQYLNEKRKPQTMIMGCYGIGVTRVLAAGIETLSNGDKIQWPSGIAPYQICIIPQKEGHRAEDTFRLSEELYHDLNKLDCLRDEVVLDDRINMTIGKRNHEAARIGYPFRVIVGRKALEDPPKYELVNVYKNEKEFIYLEKHELLSRIVELITQGKLNAT